MRGRLWIILGLFAGLTGCREDKSLGEFDATEVRSLHVVDAINTLTDASSGREMERELPEGYVKPQVNVVAGGEGYKNSQFQSGSVMGTVYRSPGFRGSDADYIDKGSVYWNLNWIRKQIQSGSLPSNLKEAVKKTRKLLGTVVRDRNFTTADEAVTALEEGIEHLDAQNALKMGNVDTRLVPWGAGREAAARYFEKDKGSHTDANKFLRRTSGSLSIDASDDLLSSHYRRLGHHTAIVPGVKEAQNLAISYAEKYSASPEEMMRRAWSKAIEKTNKLRDALGLMRRTENSDRDDVSVPMIFGTTPAPEIQAEEPGTLSDDVVPIPSIHGASRPIDMPTSSLREPDNPFGKP